MKFLLQSTLAATVIVVTIQSSFAQIVPVMPAPKRQFILITSDPKEPTLDACKQVPIGSCTDIANSICAKEDAKAKAINETLHGCKKEKAAATRVAGYYAICSFSCSKEITDV